MQSTIELLEMVTQNLPISHLKQNLTKKLILKCGGGWYFKIPFIIRYVRRSCHLAILDS